MAICVLVLLLMIDGMFVMLRCSATIFATTFALIILISARFAQTRPKVGPPGVHGKAFQKHAKPVVITRSSRASAVTESS